jgi:outer membrane protein TolC
MELEAARQELRLAGNIRLPQMDFTAGYTLQADDAKSLGLSKDAMSALAGSSAAKGWRAGLNLSWPLGNRHATAQRDLAKAAAAQVELAVALAENQVRMDVREALRALEASRARYAKATEAARLAARQYENERRLLDLDRSDAFRLLQMETQMADLELARLQAALALAQAGTASDLAMGTLTRKYFPEGRSGWYGPQG